MAQGFPNQAANISRPPPNISSAVPANTKLGALDMSLPPPNAPPASSRPHSVGTMPTGMLHYGVSMPLGGIPPSMPVQAPTMKPGMPPSVMMPPGLPPAGIMPPGVPPPGVPPPGIMPPSLPPPGIPPTAAMQPGMMPYGMQPPGGSSVGIPPNQQCGNYTGWGNANVPPGFSQQFSANPINPTFRHGQNSTCDTSDRQSARDNHRSLSPGRGQSNYGDRPSNVDHGKPRQSRFDDGTRSHTQQNSRGSSHRQNDMDYGADGRQERHSKGAQRSSPSRAGRDSYGGALSDRTGERSFSREESRDRSRGSSSVDGGRNYGRENNRSSSNDSNRGCRRDNSSDRRAGNTMVDKSGGRASRWDGRREGSAAHDQVTDRESSKGRSRASDVEKNMGGRGAHRDDRRGSNDGGTERETNRNRGGGVGNYYRDRNRGDDRFHNRSETGTSSRGADRSHRTDVRSSRNNTSYGRLDSRGGLNTERSQSRSSIDSRSPSVKSEPHVKSEAVEYQDSFHGRRPYGNPQRDRSIYNNRRNMPSQRPISLPPPREIPKQYLPVKEEPMDPVNAQKRAKCREQNKPMNKSKSKRRSRSASNDSMSGLSSLSDCSLSDGESSHGRGMCNDSISLFN